MCLSHGPPNVRTDTLPTERFRIALDSAENSRFYADRADDCGSHCRSFGDVCRAYQDYLQAANSSKVDIHYQRARDATFARADQHGQQSSRGQL